MSIRLIQKANARIRRWPNLLLPAVVVIFGLLTTAAGGYLIEEGRLARERLRFDAVVDQANDAVGGRLGNLHRCC